MRRPSRVVIRVAAPVVASCCAMSCAVVVGLDGYGVVDARDASPTEDGQQQQQVDGGGDSASDGPSTTTDSSTALPPTCDGGTDLSCVLLPSGFQLVAVADLADINAAPSCPSGFDVSSDLRTAITPKVDACTCTCSVTQQATCAGPLMNNYGLSFLCGQPGDPQYFNNAVAGGCNADVPVSPAPYQSFKPPAAMGGACGLNGAVVAHADRIDQGALSRVCDDTKRCSGGTCDARVPAPFAACVAKAGGDVNCPPGFPSKRVVGTSSSFDCGPCDCTVTRTPCTGTITTYLKTSCESVDENLPLNGLCQSIGSGNTWRSYHVEAKTTTGCDASAKAASINMESPRTICCP